MNAASNRICAPSEFLNVERRDDGGARITGYAAVFYSKRDPGTEFRLSDVWVERIHPGAFDKTVRDDDVVALFNHNPEKILGRKSAGTLRLDVDRRGLRYEIDADSDDTADTVVRKIRRGELKGSSFGFRITDEDQEVEDGTRVRNVRGVELIDVGPVTFPAYDATTADLRSLDAALERRLALDGQTAEIRRDLDRYGIGG